MSVAAGFSESSLRQQQEYAAQQLELQVNQVAATLTDVPTLPDAVRAALRNLGQPVRLFGENLAQVRDRLRLELARRQVLEQEEGLEGVPSAAVIKVEPEEEAVTKYTNASPALVAARQAIATFSIQRAKTRLERERRFRQQAAERSKKRGRSQEDTKQTDDGGDKMEDATSSLTELDRLDEDCRTVYQSLRRMALEGSQYGDVRALSCVVALKAPAPLLATASWTGAVHLWNEHLQGVGQQTLCHQDRIMNMAAMPIDSDGDNNNAPNSLLCTASIDLTAKLWKIQESANVVPPDDDTDMKQEGKDDEEESSQQQYTLTEMAHLQGHALRLCRTAFHPMKRHVATTSFDHTWRLWDVETADCLLLQDGHANACFGVGFHPDGSLCATTDVGSVVQLWDLRTGKSIHHWVGRHAKRVLNADFHPANGFQLATSGDDGTIQVWDLRRRKQPVASIPAHDELVTRVVFDTATSGEYMVSTSFDGTAKVWSCRDWSLLTQLSGHQGVVSGVDIMLTDEKNAGSRLHPGIVTCGFDKTLKLWR